MMETTFREFSCKHPKVTDEPITRIISYTRHQTRSVYARRTRLSTKKKKLKKVVGFDEILPEVWKTREIDDILLRHCNAVYNQNTDGQRGASSSSLRRATSG